MRLVCFVGVTSILAVAPLSAQQAAPHRTTALSPTGQSPAVTVPVAEVAGILDIDRANITDSLSVNLIVINLGTKTKA